MTRRNVKRKTGTTTTTPTVTTMTPMMMISATAATIDPVLTAEALYTMLRSPEATSP